MKARNAVKLPLIHDLYELPCASVIMSLMDTLDELNPAQREAVEAISGLIALIRQAKG